jgi:hypothetical protein
MKSTKTFALFVLLFSSLEAFSQGSEPVEMADVLRRDGKIYTVVFGLLIILTAMIMLLIRLDRKLFRIEKEKEREQ